MSSRSAPTPTSTLISSLSIRRFRPTNPPQCVWLPIPTCAPVRGRGGNPPAPSVPQSPSPSRLAAASPRWDVLQLTEPLSCVNGPINKGANRFCVSVSVRSLCGLTALVTVMKCREKETDRKKERV
ncbi:uncharacterized [Tachysurus ichikawai]